MANLSQFLASSSPRAIDAAGPGSNGFWRRQIYRMPGTYTWTAPKSGRVKIQAVGAAAGGQGDIPGPSAAYGDKLLNVVEGQTLTIVIGAGTDGTAGYGAAAARAGTTSISGTPVGGTPLSLIGSAGFAGTGSSGLIVSNTITGLEAGTASGPWDRSFPGSKPFRNYIGGPSSGSPFGPGFSGDGYGGSGWGGACSGGPAAQNGASSHNPASRVAVGGLFAKAGEAKPFWDMESVDSGSGRAGDISQDTSGGPGAGGGYVSNGSGSPSALGGGTGITGGSSIPGGNSGPGAGGGGASNSTTLAGRGGNGFVMIFFDEVQ